MGILTPYNRGTEKYTEMMVYQTPKKALRNPIKRKMIVNRADGDKSVIEEAPCTKFLKKNSKHLPPQLNLKNVNSN
jgi:hypothetical protein